MTKLATRHGVGVRLRPRLPIELVEELPPAGLPLGLAPGTAACLECDWCADRAGRTAPALSLDHTRQTAHFTVARAG